MAIPKYQQREWNETYEQLTEFIVPRSSKVLTEDNDLVLVTVTLFKKVRHFIIRFTTMSVTVMIIMGSRLWNDTLVIG